MNAKQKDNLTKLQQGVCPDCNGEEIDAVEIGLDMTSFYCPACNNGYHHYAKAETLEKVV